MVTLLWGLLIILCLQLVFVLWNLPHMPKLARLSVMEVEGEREDEPTAQLSVLIPARDEEANIGECLDAVLANSYPFLEVIVLNDRSSDGTAEEIAKRAARDGRVRMIDGAELPEGWLGKSYACHQLAQQAAGEWWLFLDADARLAPCGLERAARAATRQQRGLLTGFARQVTVTWLEKLVVPMMLFVIACHLPIRLVRHSKDPRFAAAHGGFMLIHRDTYFKSGGHEALKNSMVDDMALARAVKQIGEPLELMNIGGEVSMRMYRHASEVWNGYKKNMYDGVGRSAPLLGLILCLYVMLYVFPWLLLPWAVVQPELFASVASLCVLGIVLKARVNYWCGQPIWLAVLMPFSAVAMVAIGFESWRAAAKGSGYSWKGRTYH